MREDFVALTRGEAKALNEASQVTTDGRVLAAVWNHHRNKRMARLRKENKCGYIYLVRLSPGVFKVGFASDPIAKDRQKEAATWGLELEVLGTWRALKKWEPQARYVIQSRKTLLQAMTEWDYADRKRVKGDEVFTYEGNVNNLIERANSLFSKAYPKVGGEK